jgi:hypothetical protein
MVEPQSPPEEHLPKPLTFWEKYGKYRLPVVALLAVLVSGSIFIAANTTQAPSQTTPTLPQPSPSASPTATTDLTTNWMTYTNTKYGYSFKYPSNYTPYDFSTSEFTAKDDSKRITLASSQLPRSSSGEYLPYALDIEATNKLQLDSLKGLLEAAVQRGDCTGCPKKYTGQVNGYQATIYDGYLYLTNVKEPLQKIFLLEHNGKYFIITRHTGENEPTFPYDISEQILSTFKFID